MRLAWLKNAALGRISGKIVAAFLLSALVLAGGTGGAAANAKYAGIVMDAKTGAVLYESHADASRYPASLTKMMTLYLMFEALSSGRISKGTRIPFSQNAAAEPPTKLGIRPGNSINVEQAIYALVTKSANDVSTAVAEYLGGSESGFAKMMTDKARLLGMSRTTFKNAHGLPNSQQKTTARDMARLGIALREHFPGYYDYFETRSFTYKNRRYGNHNNLLGRVEGVDGIKTGYTRASGFNLVSSVKADRRSIVAVVMGGRTSRSRDAHMADLIERYLHKASTGGDRMLIAKRGGSSFAMLPGDEVPLPTDRPEARTLTAYAAEKPIAASAAARFAAAKPRPSAPTADAAEPAPEAAPAPRPTTPVGDSGGQVDPVQTASTAAGGWVIQVASMPSESAAVSFLNATEEKAPTVLASAVPLTETFVKNGTTYHRARFAGFDSKSSAWQACSTLKKQGVACYAVQQ